MIVTVQVVAHMVQMKNKKTIYILYIWNFIHPLIYLYIYGFLFQTHKHNHDKNYKKTTKDLYVDK